MNRKTNYVELTGNVGPDPKFGVTDEGRHWINFRLATTERWTDKKTHEEEKHTVWHDVCAFGPLAEEMSRELRKGKFIDLVGKIRTRKSDRDGRTEYRQQVHVDRWEEVLRRATQPASDSAAPAA